jgi:prevent-host-death family protein
MEATTRSAAVASLKARLSEYLGRIKRGEELLVMERGEPVAMIVPIGRETRGDARLARRVASGVVNPGQSGLAAVLASAWPTARRSRPRHGRRGYPH